MRSSYTTQKGTELPILNLRGKEYLEVKYRVVWFREEKPEWSIETEMLSVTTESAYARAAIKNESGRTIATSHKFEDKKGFPDFIEKAETGAIGRALALCGFGTQFCADEFDEGERIVDSPVEPKSGPAPVEKTASKSEPKAAAGPETWKWPFPYPKGMKDIALGDLGTDGLKQAESSLLNWKSSPEKKFPANAQKILDAVTFLLEPKSNGVAR